MTFNFELTADASSRAPDLPGARSDAAVSPEEPKPRRRALLVGQPNVGKSVVFGALTGTYVTVSNYPGTTVEITRGRARFGSQLWEVVDTPGTHNLVPMIEGRSSIGRLGLFVHVTAGFGDVGFCGYWTLEMFAVQPIRIYPGVAICQIFYHDICGDFVAYNSDKYQNNNDIQPSLLFRELSPQTTPDPQRKLPFGMEQSF